MRSAELWIEKLLWSSRLIILVPVLASVLTAIAALFMATVDVVHLLRAVLGYGNTGLSHAQHAALNSELTTTMVKAIDGYLLTAILLIFALGLYELFISRIDAAEQSEVAPRLLLIRSLDDLKDRLAKVVILILVITFFQQALQMTYRTTLDLLYLALGTVLVGGALFLSSKAVKTHESHHAPPFRRTDSRDADTL